MELEQKLEELKNGIESKTKTQIENELKAIKESFEASSKAI